jgi:uncharacterized protein YciI
MILAVSRYLRPLEEVDQARSAHQDFLATLDDRGLLVMAGRQRPPVGAVIVLRGDDADGAQALLDDDPYVKHGLAAYSITPFAAARGSVRD